MTLHQVLAYRKAERFSNDLKGVAAKNNRFHNIDLDALRTHKIKFKPKVKPSKKKIAFSADSETLHFSYQNPKMNSVKRKTAVFPHLEDKVFFDIKIAYFDLDISLRECSVLSLSTYQEICAKFADSDTNSGHKENTPENL